MAAVAAIAGVGMMVCCSSSVAALMMGGDGDDSSDSAAGAGAGAGAGAKTPTGPTLPSAQYVKVERPTGTYPGNIVNLGEIEVFDKAGTNIALNAVVTGGPGGAHSAGPFANLTDGDVTGLVGGNFAHTTGDGVGFLQVDLGAVKEIAKVVITNRGNNADGGCCGNRLGDAKLILLDASSTAVKTTAVIDTTKLKITYDFNVATPAWVYADA
jgi:hypothetical protein